MLTDADIATLDAEARADFDRAFTRMLIHPLAVIDLIAQRKTFLDLLEDCRDVLDGVLGNCEPDCECILHTLDEVLPVKA